MSFILDALKKSEERRRLHEEAHQPRQKLLDLSWSGPRRWPVWLFFAVLLAALAGGWWLRGASLQFAVESQKSAAVAHLPPHQAATPATVPRSVAAETRGETPPGQEVARPVPFAPVPVGSVVEPASPAHNVSPAAVDASVAPAIRPQATMPAASAPPARPRPVASTIPAALRDRKPMLAMTLHFYTEEPARRMVRIDDRIVREGQAVADQLVLEEITPGGAVFSYAGERFELSGPGR
jgi:general secretion pathway protein B